MRCVIGSVLVLLGCCASAAAELPPKVLADKYLIQAEQLLEKKDYDAALSLMDKIIALQKEHNFTLGDEFHFKHAQMAYSAGTIQTVIDAVSTYLAAGSEGEYYKEALALLIKAEEELADLEVTPEKMCTGKPKGASCWRALSNHPECYVWVDDYDEKWTVTWSGKCSDGLASGEGRLKGIYRRMGSGGFYESYMDSLVVTGRLRNGKFHGHCDIMLNESKVFKQNKRTYWNRTDYRGPYENGKKHGNWFYRNSSNLESIDDGKTKGEYVHGKREGAWLKYYIHTKRCVSWTYRQGKYLGSSDVDITMCQGW